MKLPNWPTIILPAGSEISGKASPCSRMPGDIAVRTSVASISMRALRSAFSMMSSVTGSIATLAKGVVLGSMILAGIGLTLRLESDEDVADSVHSRAAIVLDQRGRIHFGDDRRAFDHVALP